MTRLSGLLVVGLMLLVYARAEDKSYSVELNSFKNMSKSEVDVELVDWGTLRINHVGRNKYTLDGDIEFKRNMGNEQAISLPVFVYKEDTKKIGPLMLTVSKRFCQFVNEKSNLPEQGDCPFLKGKYTIDNNELETTFLTNMPMGDYLLKLIIVDSDRSIGGLGASFTLTQ